MSTNFLQWNPAEANQEDDAAYLADSLRSGGAVTDAIFFSPLANKLFYQVSTMVTALAELLVAQGIVASDADLSILTQALSAALRTGTWAGTSAGSANAQTLAPAIAVTSYREGESFRFVAGFTNTGAATLNISGLGAVPLRKRTPAGPAALTGSEIVAGNEITVMYDSVATAFQIAAVTPGAPALVWAGVSGGSANTQTLTPTVAPSSYLTGAAYSFIPGFSNTGATTINVSGLGAIAVRKGTAAGLAALTGGEIIAGQQIMVTYDGTFFQLASEPAPTITLKSGSNAGNYSTASGSFVDVDSANLGLTVTIPVGWKLVIQTAGIVNAPAIGTSVTTDVSISDGGVVLNQLTIQDSNGDPSQNSFALAWVINGDGASHTITLQYKKDGGSASNAIINNSGGAVPTIVFTLSPSN